MTIERFDIKHTMWRKKVDNSIFSSGHIVIPKAYVKQWKILSEFQDNGKNAEMWPIQIRFDSKLYEGKVFFRPSIEFLNALRILVRPVLFLYGLFIKISE